MTVNRDIDDRWLKGIPHHPKSEELFSALRRIDLEFGNGHFCWRAGGDGDDGEELMYGLDIYFECLDAGEPLFGEQP